MHLVIPTAGSRGDLEPYLALGVRALAQGWRVTIVTHATFEARVTALGLGWRPLSGDPRAIIAQPSTAAWFESGSRLAEVRAFGGFVRTIRQQYARQLDDIADATTDADVVVYNAVCRPAAQLHEARGTPVIAAYLQPFEPTGEYPATGLTYRQPRTARDRARNRVSHVAGLHLLWLAARPTVNRWRRDRLALPPLPWRGPFLRQANAQYPVLHAFSPTLLPRPADWPPWVQQTSWWHLPAPDYVPSPALAHFFDRGEAPVVIGFGSMTPVDARRLTGMALEAAERAEVRVLFLQGWGNLGATALPSWAHVEPEVPHDWLLPRTSAVVHHAGSGTTGAVVRAGVPSFGIPLGFDQPFWASLLHARGVATAPVRRGALTVDAFTHALRQLRDDDAMRARAAALGALVRAEDGVGDAVAFIADHVAISSR
jgi:sterol 3beta-glucosyltransferase